MAFYNEVTMKAVVEVFEGVRPRTDCILGSEHPCSAHAAWRALKKAYREFLESTTLADIATHPGAGTRNLAGGEGGGM